MATAQYSALFPHVAPRCRELLHILVHGAANLPNIGNRLPQYYVTAQSHTTVAGEDNVETINATNYVEGISPQWNEMIYVDISEDKSQSEGVIFFIIDEVSKKKIVEYHLLWRWLAPFYEYHLNLQKTLPQTSQTTCLYVSIMKKQSSLSKENIRYFGLEALLNGFDVPITNSQSSYVIARIVPDYKSYRHSYRQNKECHKNFAIFDKIDFIFIHRQTYLLDQRNESHGIKFKVVEDPSEQDFILPEFSDDGYPQLSLASKRAAQPTFLPPQLYQPPQYDFVQSAPQAPAVDNTRYRIPRINPYDLDDIPTEYRAMLATNYPPRRDDDINGWFDYFEREVALYKQAIRRIIQDVTQLRDQHKTLRAANADLRTKIENFEKKKKVLYEIFEGDKIDKAKIQDIFNRLNAKISAQSLELKENYAKIIAYEKELARRGELRAQYDALVRSSQAREVEIKLLQQRIGKADGLEETVRRQEMVIERLESMINNYMKQKRLGGAFNDIDRNFLSEHAALGLETQQLQRRVSPGRHTAMVNSHRDDLLQQNIAYQQELATLKARLQENSAAWGKEKVELLSKINDMEPLSPTPPTRIRKPKPY
ncbi:unnamed protein product [Rotaria sp. Silwood1]|nr:unnamed protein product [Rotaria sp. Silwood1]